MLINQTYLIKRFGTTKYISLRKFMVYLILHPHGIATTFLKLDLWSPGAGFIPIISTKGINKSDKERKIERRKFSFMHAKRFNTFL